jgi:DNA-binding XRE family transcriptional regulator
MSAKKLKAKKPKRVNLGPRLKAWRKRRAKETGEPFTQNQAAAELGVNPATYPQYENGNRGAGMSEFQYDHIIAKTARNGSKSPPAPESS